MSTFVGIPNQGVSSKAIDDAEELTSPWDASHTDTFQVGDPQEDDKSLQLGSNGAKFACPFFKRNPEKYRDSRSCTGPGWATVRRTKEHLYRHHYSFACSRCYRCFSDDKGLVAHENQGTCRRVGAARKPDGLDAEKVKQLRRRKREANKPEDKKWKEMYRIVFPKDDTNAIPSPYYDYVPSGTATRGQPGLPSELGSPMTVYQKDQDANSELMAGIRRTMEPLRGSAPNPTAFEATVVDMYRLVCETLSASRTRTSPQFHQPSAASGMQPHDGYSTHMDTDFLAGMGSTFSGALSTGMDTEPWDPGPSTAEPTSFGTGWDLFDVDSLAPWVR